MNTKVVAVVVVVILVVVAVGVAAIVSDDEETSSSSSSSGALEIYGNADGDNNIAQDDINLIESIISDNLDWKTDYPLADANCDGKVDSSDVAQVEAILGATVNNQVRVYYNAYATTGSYVDSFRYPVQYAMTSCNQTTVISLKTLGIVDQIRGYSYSSISFDKYIYADYLSDSNEYCIGESTRMGSSNTAVNVDLASNFVTDGCTLYVYSSSNSPLTNLTSVNEAGIDTLQIADAAADLDSYSTALLILGFAFGEETYQAAVEIVAWMTELVDDQNEHLASVYAGTVTQVKAVASSMSTYVSVSGSANAILVEAAGLDCPLASTAPDTGSTSTMRYYSDSTWLNYISLDTVIVLKGSTSDWSWFDKDYDNIPSSFVSHLEGFSTLQCYQEGNCVIVSTMLPAPLKSAIMAQYFYPDLFEDNWAEDYISEFLSEYWNFTDDQIEGQKYILTQAEVLG